MHQTSTSTRRTLRSYAMRASSTRQPQLARVPRRNRRVVGIVAAAAIAVGALIPQTAQAGRSWSQTIAAQAKDALDSLHQWQASNSPDDELAYALLRDRLATTIAGAVGVDGVALSQEWSQVDVINQEVVLIAVTQLGVPYRYARSKEGVAFDCSGITLYAYGKVGVTLPRVSTDQIRSGEKISASEAETGDLVQYPGHIMMYLGGGVILQARSTGHYVEVAPLPSKSLRYADVTPDGDSASNAAGIGAATTAVSNSGAVASGRTLASATTHS